MSGNPSTHVPFGHDFKGRFAKGNRLGRGNPLAGKAAKIRAALFKAATADDVRAICRALIDGARGGDLAFLREFFDRTAGKATDVATEERLALLEMKINERPT